jgi:hypothetical protein
MGITDIAVKKVVREIDLGEYQPEYAGTVVEVWVNPPIRVWAEGPKLAKKWDEARLRSSLLKMTPEEREKALEKLAEKGVEPPDLGKGLIKDKIERAEHEAEAAKEAYHRWFAQVWEGSTEDEVLAMTAKLEAEEPGMLVFLRDRTVRMIIEYAQARKKA